MTDQEKSYAWDVVIFLVFVGLAFSFWGCKAMLPDIQVSACLFECRDGMYSCNAALDCGETCAADGTCHLCAQWQVMCVDSAFRCAIACAGEVEQQLQ